MDCLLRRQEYLEASSSLSSRDPLGARSKSMGRSVTGVIAGALRRMLYNLSQQGLFLTATLTHSAVRRRRWQRALIAIAICSLTLSVATRFWTPLSSQSHIVKSIDRRPGEPKRQHLDRDATRWVAPRDTFSMIEPGAIEIRLPAAGPLLPKHVFTDSLYNRPPPSSEFFL